jgi:ABC-type phosphate/phosphonate transport system ATPase subunit
MGDNEHCGLHKTNTEMLEENTVAIAGIKSSGKTLVWIVPIAIAVAASVTGYTLSSMNDNIKSVSSSVTRIETVVQQAAITAAANGTRLDYLEREITNRGHK